jgi:hypothetical protein
MENWKRILIGSLVAMQGMVFAVVSPTISNTYRITEAGGNYMN